MTVSLGGPPGASDTPTGQHIASIVSNGVADAARPAVAFAGVVVTAGALISLLVPSIPAEPHVPTTPTGDWPAVADVAYPDPDAELEPNPTS